MSEILLESLSWGGGGGGSYFLEGDAQTQKGGFVPNPPPLVTGLCMVISLSTDSDKNNESVKKWGLVIFLGDL